ncbi:hypothetical protein [Sutcliffiella horikoshii]|uniref:hypothetical protein n=1 Tax=Sutcliffiella horikoshii TaxID=79883 RepID=UPI001653C8C0|nr:hypothetical protein [Sutcliffiella horikoshii]
MNCLNDFVGGELLTFGEGAFPREVYMMVNRAKLRSIPRDERSAFTYPSHHDAMSTIGARLVTAGTVK